MSSEQSGGSAVTFNCEKAAYSISEVLNMVPLGRTRVYEEIAMGRLIARKVGRRTLVLAADLEGFLQNLPRVK